MKNEIISIKFNVGGFFGYDNFKVEVHKNKTSTILHESLSGSSILPEMVEMNKAETARFLTEIEACGVFKWRRHYQPEFLICDGTQWNLEIERTGKRLFVRDGDNEYPQLWNAFCRIFGIGTDRPQSIQLSLRKTNHIVLPPSEVSPKFNEAIIEYKESIELNADTDKMTIRQEYGEGCIITKEFYVQQGVEELLEAFQSVDDDWHDEQPYEDTTGVAFYSLCISAYDGTKTMHQGIYNNKNLPDEWADIITSISEFVNFYDQAELLNLDSFNNVEETVYSVEIEGTDKTLYYFADDNSLNIGDKVVVPFGRDNHERIGVIELIEQKKVGELPFSVDKMKSIIRRSTEVEESNTSSPRMSKDEIKKRLAGRAAEYFMFKDDED